MVNGHIDLEVIIFTLGQYALVLFVGFLAFYGLFQIIMEMRERKAASLDNTIEVWEKKKKLYQVKREYFDMKKEMNPGIFRSLAETMFEKDDEECTDDSLDAIRYSPDNIVPNTDMDETKEVEILSLNEELAKDPNFLSHSDDSEDTKIVSRTEIIKQDNIPQSETIPSKSSCINTPVPNDNLTNNVPCKHSDEEVHTNPEKKKSGFLSSLFEDFLDAVL